MPKKNPPTAVTMTAKTHKTLGDIIDAKRSGVIAASLDRRVAVGLLNSGFIDERVIATKLIAKHRKALDRIKRARAGGVLRDEVDPLAEAVLCGSAFAEVRAFATAAGRKAHHNAVVKSPRPRAKT